LARSIGTEQAEELPGPHLQIEAVECRDLLMLRGIDLSQPRGLDDRPVAGIDRREHAGKLKRWIVRVKRRGFTPTRDSAYNVRLAVARWAPNSPGAHRGFQSSQEDWLESDRDRTLGSPTPHPGGGDARGPSQHRDRGARGPRQDHA